MLLAKTTGTKKHNPIQKNDVFLHRCPRQMLFGKPLKQTRVIMHRNPLADHTICKMLARKDAARQLHVWNPIKTNNDNVLSNPFANDSLHPPGTLHIGSQSRPYQQKASIAPMAARHVTFNCDNVARTDDTAAAWISIFR